MSRIINVDNPTKIRNRNRRSIAEILRQLIQKPGMDEEAKDMAATIVLLLREIQQGTEQTATAWEKRGYWMKSERFLREWEWAIEHSANIEDVIRHEAWDLLPELMVGLFPKFADIEIKTITRKASLWNGNYKKLLELPPGKQLWEQ